MLIINSPETFAAAVASLLDPQIESLLRLRIEQLTGYPGYNPDDLAVFIVIQPADTLAEIEAELRIPLTVNLVDGSRWLDGAEFTPSWEWCEDHGGLFEITFILDDSGYGHVLLVPDQGGIDPKLRSLARTFTNAL